MQNDLRTCTFTSGGIRRLSKSFWQGFWRTLLATTLFYVALAAGLASCGNSSVRSPFQLDAGEAAGAAGAADSDGGLNVGIDAGDLTLGGPCADDTQCDDAIPCTHDSCDQNLQHCRHVPDDMPCSDGVYCNGEEVCDPKLGCKSGAPVTCADNDPCTIDTCVEKTHTCSRAPRDEDGDGDPVWNCPGGADCDDTDPTVSSKASEVCANGKDDNCNGQTDEAPCASPEYDTCANPLVINASGSSSLSLVAAKLDYPTQCAPAGGMLADLVVALQVGAGPNQDVDVVAQTAGAQVALATATSCGKANDVQCAPSVDTQPGALSRLRLYNLAAGVYPLYVAGSMDAEIALSVTFSDSIGLAQASNETCGTATELKAGVPQTASLVDVQTDMTSACAAKTGELVYHFSLQGPRDINVLASPLDAYGDPQLSLRNANCPAASSELTCRNGAPSAALFARALPAGDYYVSVAASGPADVDLRLEESAPTAQPPDEGCAMPLTLAPNQTLELSLAAHTDAVNLGCLAGAVDSTQALELGQSSDVLLVERIADGDTGAVSLAQASCSKETRLACGTASSSPVRASAAAVLPGSYRVVAEESLGNPVALTAFTRKAVPQAFVLGADDCSAPFEIPATGGRFKGNTANAHADFSAGCDVPNQSQNGAPDQILHLALDTKSRVVLDMNGSNYATMLSVRSGDTCPGTELPLSCAAGYAAQRSFLDLDLEPGNYFVQIDGYSGDVGAWLLDVYVTPETP